MIKEVNIDRLNPFKKKIVYIIDNKEIGYIEYSYLYDRVEIDDVLVEESYRNKKIASKLMEYLVEYCKEQNVFNITLEVRENNYIAIKLYEKYGFKKVAMRDKYYGSINGILMEKKW